MIPGKDEIVKVACCITSHGYGHAARAVSIMEALGSRVKLQLDIITTVPVWFFEESLSVPFEYHGCEIDMGIVQSSSLQEDLAATLEKLATFYPVREEWLETVVSCLKGCRLVLCDVAPLGILAAKAAGIPAVLIENFTWDWIYKQYAAKEKEFGYFSDYLKGIYSQVDYRIQTEPICNRLPGAVTISPASRKTKNSPEQLRSQLKTQGRKIVLLTMGGIGWHSRGLEALTRLSEYVFIITGGAPEITFQENLRLIPQNSGFYHPDLVAASDAVIGKVGYSTLAEIYHAEVPWGYISRPGFPESNYLSAFIKSQLRGIEIPIKDFTSGQWTGVLPALIELNPKDKLVLPQSDRVLGYNAERCNESKKQNGADQAARFIESILKQKTYRSL